MQGAVMSLLLLSFMLVALAFSVGAVIARAIAAIPLAVLEHAQEGGGRFVGLGSRDATSPATPSAGRRIGPLVAAQGYGY
jgi:hypothetical protein